VAGDFGRDIVFACLTKGFDRRTNAPIVSSAMGEDGD
jgi:hypothetical protein